MKQIGFSKQMEAEAILDKHASRPFKQVRNTKTGQLENYRDNIADILIRKKKMAPLRSYHTVPAFPAGFWEK